MFKGVNKKSVIFLRDFQVYMFHLFDSFPMNNLTLITIFVINGLILVGQQLWKNYYADDSI